MFKEIIGRFKKKPEPAILNPEFKPLQFPTAGDIFDKKHHVMDDIEKLRIQVELLRRHKR